MWGPYIAGALSLFSGLSTQFLNPFYVSLRLWPPGNIGACGSGEVGRGARMTNSADPPIDYPNAPPLPQPAPNSSPSSSCVGWGLLVHCSLVFISYIHSFPPLPFASSLNPLEFGKRERNEFSAGYLEPYARLHHLGNQIQGSEDLCEAGLWATPIPWGRAPRGFFNGRLCSWGGCDCVRSLGGWVATNAEESLGSTCCQGQAGKGDGEHTSPGVLVVLCAKGNSSPVLGRTTPSIALTSRPGT